MEQVLYMTNDIRMFNVTKDISKAVHSAYTLENPEYVAAKRMGYRAWNIPKQLFLFDIKDNCLILARGQKNSITKILQKLGYSVKVVDGTAKGEPINYKWDEKFILRDYQMLAVAKAVNDSGCIIIPAGGGKTIVGMNIIFQLGIKALWITHTKDLMYQSADKALQTLGVKCGIVGDSKNDIGDEITIATVQTLSKSEDKLNQFRDYGIVIIDETHHVPSSMFTEVLNKIRPFRTIGLTATPDRKDKLQDIMYAYVGPILVEIPRSVLYETKKLIVPTLKPMYTPFSSSTAFSKNNAIDIGGDGADWHKLRQLVIDCEKRKKFIVKTIVDNYVGEKNLCLSEWVEYGQYFVDYLRTVLPNNVRVEFIHGSVNKKDRATMLKDFEDNKIDILFATKLAREGLDLPNLTNLFLLTPKRGDTGKSRDGAALEQEIGRVMRVDPNNLSKKATIYDFVDYDNSTLKSQWYSRRKVYKRLEITIPSKPRTKADGFIEKLFPGLL